MQKLPIYINLAVGYSLLGMFCFDKSPRNLERCENALNKFDCFGVKIFSLKNGHKLFLRFYQTSLSIIHKSGTLARGLFIIII